LSELANRAAAALLEVLAVAYFSGKNCERVVRCVDRRQLGRQLGRRQLGERGASQPDPERHVDVNRIWLPITFGVGHGSRGYIAVKFGNEGLTSHDRAPQQRVATAAIYGTMQFRATRHA
jgi:hypothetical protein